jgi:hypothetical protein
MDRLNPIIGSMIIVAIIQSSEFAPESSGQDELR